MRETPVHGHESNIDWNELWTRVGEDGDLLIELVTLFVQDTPQHLIRVQSAIDRDHGPDLAVSAHAFKGSAATFGLKRLVRLLEQIESLGRAARASQAIGLFGEALDETSRMTVALKNGADSLARTGIAQAAWNAS